MKRGLITLDFESYYDTGYSLSGKSMTTEQYVRDSKFEVIGLSLKVNDEPATWHTGDLLYLHAVLSQIDWKRSALLAHNCRFDAAILAWRFGITPKMYMDTLSMARGLVGLRTSLSLHNLGRFFNLQRQKGDEVVKAFGKRRADFTPTELAAYGSYCVNDTEMCYDLAQILIPQTLPTELQLQDTPPAPGRETTELEYAGRQWQTLSEVRAGADPDLLQVTVWVALAERRRSNRPLRERAVTSLSGFIGVR